MQQNNFYSKKPSFLPQLQYVARDIDIDIKDLSLSLHATRHACKMAKNALISDFHQVLLRNLENMSKACCGRVDGTMCPAPCTVLKRMPGNSTV